MDSYLRRQVLCHREISSENVKEVKEFVTDNGGKFLADYHLANSFTVLIPASLESSLKSHKYVKYLVLDLDSKSDTQPVDVLSQERKRLIKHLGIAETRGGEPPSVTPSMTVLFFIEVAPFSPRGAKCKRPGCERMIDPGDLRLAMHPGMDNWYGRLNASFYHPECFEFIADFSRNEFIRRVQPLTRINWQLRGLSVSAVIDGTNFVSGGVERLVKEWRVTHWKMADKRDGVHRETEDDNPADFTLLYYQGGSSSYNGCKLPEGMSDVEYFNFLEGALAPNESDGPDDTAEWNLFTEYLDSTPQALEDPFSLSTMLQNWELDVALANMDEAELNELQAKARHALGEKAIRALKRLSRSPMQSSPSLWG